MDRQDQQENQPIKEIFHNPELQNQADGKECKSMLKGKNLAILIAVALGIIIVNAIVTVAIVSCNKSEVKSNTEEDAEKVSQETSDIHSDLWQNLEGRSFDLVTANLPYVSESEYACCAPEIFFEPVMALTAPENGLELMKKTIAGLPGHLNRGGTAIFELSDHQNAVICDFGAALGFNASAMHDMEGKARFALLQRENFG